MLKWPFLSQLNALIVPFSPILFPLKISVPFPRLFLQVRSFCSGFKNMVVPPETVQMFLPASHTIPIILTLQRSRQEQSLKPAWDIQLGYTASQSETPPHFLLFLKYREHTQTKLNQSPITSVIIGKKSWKKIPSISDISRILWFIASKDHSVYVL